MLNIFPPFPPPRLLTSYLIARSFTLFSSSFLSVNSRAAPQTSNLSAPKAAKPVVAALRRRCRRSGRLFLKLLLLGSLLVCGVAEPLEALVGVHGLQRRASVVIYK